MAKFFTGETATITRPCRPWSRYKKTINHNVNHNDSAISNLIQVQKLEAKKLEEILRNPKTATAKNLLLSISKEILNPEMAAFASSYATIAVKLRRRLKKMKGISNAEFE